MMIGTPLLGSPGKGSAGPNLKRTPESTFITESLASTTNLAARETGCPDRHLDAESEPQAKYKVGFVLALDGTLKAKPFARTGFDEMQGQFSPDGRWIAYASEESGRIRR
jgi:WD40-like Beta Propeller Repeat